MTYVSLQKLIRRAQAAALLGLPSAWILMLVLHFRSLEDLFTLRLRYVPTGIEEKVTRIIAARNRWPLAHDPHLIGYLSLPLLVLAAFGLYALSRQRRPLLATLGLSLTVLGSIYLGGIFGLFTALTRGLGDVDPQYTTGAIATYAAVTADHGAYGLTRLLAHFAMVGILVQGISLWKTAPIPPWAAAAIGVGAALIVAFWDLDNLMLLGTALILAGAVPVAAELRRLGATRPAGAHRSAASARVIVRRSAASAMPSG